MGDAGDGIDALFRERVIQRGQTFDLLDIEDGVAFQEIDFLFGSSPVSASVSFFVIEFAYTTSALTFAHMRAQLLRLPVDHPDRRGEAFEGCVHPERENIDP
jgi:hypothetical protein